VLVLLMYCHCKRKRNLQQKAKKPTGPYDYDDEKDPPLIYQRGAKKKKQQQTKTEYYDEEEGEQLDKEEPVNAINASLNESVD